jgi:hypothetical protein
MLRRGLKQIFLTQSTAEQTQRAAELVYLYVILCGSSRFSLRNFAVKGFQIFQIPRSRSSHGQKVIGLILNRFLIKAENIPGRVTESGSYLG